MFGGDRKSSKAWQFFTDLKNDKAKCNFCQKEFSYKGGGAYNLIRHTKSKHPQVFVAIRECPHDATVPIASSATEVRHSTTTTNSPRIELQIPAASTSTASTSSGSTAIVPKASGSLPILTTTSTSTDLCKPKCLTTNPKLTQFFHKPLSAKKTEYLNKLLVKVFTKNFLAFNLIESAELKQFIKELNPSYQLPSRKTLSNALLTNFYNKTKEIVKSEINKSEHVSITTDGWTSAPNDNYIAVTVHFFNQQAEFKSFLLECIQFSDRHTSENLAEQLKTITDAWDITDKIVAATSDNAFNIKGAIRLNKWKQIPCFAHTLNLIVQSALKEIKDITIKVKQIVEIFKRSPLACERLRNMQKKLEEPILKLKQDVSTRWNSTCDMFQRIITIKNSVMSTIAIDYPDTENITLEDIKILESAIEILTYFKDVTEEMSAEKTVTISEVILISKALKKKCQNFLSSAQPEIVKKMAQVLLNEMNSRFQGIEDNNIFAESTVLDPRFKQYGFDNEYAYGRACTNLKAMAGQIKTSNLSLVEQSHTPPPPKCKKSIWDEFDKEVGEIMKNTNPTAGGIIEVDKYLEEPLLPRSQDPAKWWFKKKDAYPRLYKLFLKRLCIVATSVPSERTFSKAGQIITDRRNKLSGNKVTQILFLNSNL
ncbi:E3 SUMO-protein ligase ZBED1-like [Bicyclus anynana]|uniref:E3 SUMO-protein ligase ZBED1-like n=1 Tax=Bicyclus anynana TaxID=110368 RepID=A0ABM3LWS5_BICAN|nr:E3 SUMO-protein ligase ZBED1-like [Bicyclus anynana]